MLCQPVSSNPSSPLKSHYRSPLRVSEHCWLWSQEKTAQQSGLRCVDEHAPRLFLARAQKKLTVIRADAEHVPSAPDSIEFVSGVA